MCLWPLTVLVVQDSHQSLEGNSGSRWGWGWSWRAQCQAPRRHVLRGVGQEWLETTGCWKTLGVEGVKSNGKASSHSLSAPCVLGCSRGPLRSLATHRAALWERHRCLIVLRTGRHREVPTPELYHTAGEDLNPAVSSRARTCAHYTHFWPVAKVLVLPLPGRSTIQPPQCPPPVSCSPAGTCHSREG